MDLLIYIFIIIYQKNSGWVFSGSTCEFCNYSASKKKFCRFYISQEDTKLSDIIQKISNEIPLFLLVNFKKYEHMFKNFYNLYVGENDPRMYLPQDINIFDCFEIYSNEKKLIGEKKFICSR